VHYSINDYVHKHKINLEVKKSWRGVGEDEEEVEVGVDPGPEEDHSAIYRLGRDPAGYSGSAEDLDEDLAEDGGAVTHTCVHVFLGFQGGGGQIQRMAPDTAQDTGIPT